MVTAAEPLSPTRRKPSWHLVYIALAGLNILSIIGGLYLSHRLVSIYTSSASTNEAWGDRLTRYTALEGSALAVNAPGNDVFDSRDADAENARQDRALAAFERKLSAERAEVAANVPEAEARLLRPRLDAVAEAMRLMVAEGDLIFRHFRLGETDRAAARMAAMDRRNVSLAGALAALRGQVHAIQDRRYRAQIASAEQLGRLEYLIGGLMVLMVGLVTFYGYKIVQKIRTDEDKLQRYSISLAEAHEAATAASKAKSDFLAVMSHEIRTPLTAVLGMADLLAVGGLSDKARKQVEIIRASGRHLLEIINDILDLSRIEAGRLALERIDFSAIAMMEQIRWLMMPQAAGRGLTLTVEHDARCAAVLRGDPTRIKQVLLNLIGNALKFTERGAVTVGASHHPAGEGAVRCRFEVLDTGIGIPEDKQAQLFQPFTQVEGSTTRVYGGTGLGLAISKRLVEAMGGEIGVESVPGEGSLFWFEIPLEVGDTAAVAERAALARSQVSPLRILVVEDVAVNRTLLGEMLSREGHTVTFAENGREAVEQVARQPFDLALMDVQMPVMDGIEATRRIRALPPPAGAMPVLGLSANVLAADREIYLRAGMNGCLAKPIAWLELFAAIAETTARRRAGARPPAPEDGGATSAPPVPEAAVPEASPPLLDRDAVELAAGATPQGLLQQVIENAEQICERLEALPAQSPELLREAHKLKGTSGLFGLRRISATAGEIQVAAREGHDTSPMVKELAAVVAATRKELRISGLVEAGSSPLPEPPA